MASDLIYCGQENYKECTEELLKEYPDAIIEDATDEIHRGRFSINVPNVERDDFYLFLLTHGYLEISLHLKLLRETKHDKYLALLKVAAERLKEIKECD